MLYVDHRVFIKLTVPLFRVLCLPTGLFVYSPFRDCIHSGSHGGLISYTGDGYWFLFRLQAYGERNVAVYPNLRIAPPFWFPSIVKRNPVKTKTSLNYISRPQFVPHREQCFGCKNQSVNAL